jgi:hypothetical protein
MSDFPIRNNFAQNYGLCMLREQSVFTMRRLVGASRDDVRSWASGVSMVPRPVSRTLMLYSALFMGNLAAVEEIHDVLRHDHAALRTVQRLLAKSGLSSASDCTSELATLLGVPVDEASSWLRGATPPPVYLQTFLIALASLDSEMRASINQAVGLVAPTAEGEGVRDAEFRLAMAVCDLTSTILATITGAQPTTVADWMLGRARPGRPVWTILSLYSVAPVNVVEELCEKGALGLSGHEARFKDAIASIGLSAEEMTDLDALAVFLNVPVNNITDWLEDTKPVPKELWALFLLLARLKPVRRFQFIRAFVDPLAAATEHDDDGVDVISPVGVSRPQSWLH